MSPSAWRSMLILSLVGLCMWACAFYALADDFQCERGDARLMVRPIGETRALCELAGARRNAEACTIPAGPNTPATIIMSSRGSARASLYTFGFWFDHELQHACGGLRAEPVA